ncbi:hypothetical protein BLOT_002672 [Blomia tropicalis]|nr:hypothetical protein BLOT_002672 [Blomia tropicalis]
MIYSNDRHLSSLSTSSTTTTEMTSNMNDFQDNSKLFQLSCLRVKTLKFICFFVLYDLVSTIDISMIYGFTNKPLPSISGKTLKVFFSVIWPTLNLMVLHQTLVSMLIHNNKHSNNNNNNKPKIYQQ